MQHKVWWPTDVALDIQNKHPCSCVGRNCQAWWCIKVGPFVDVNIGKIGDVVSVNVCFIVDAVGVDM